MQKKSLSLIILIFVLIPLNVALAAVSYTQNFDALNDGSLSTQDSWTCSGSNATVNSAYQYESNKGVRFNGYESCTRTVSETNGTYYWAVYNEFNAEAGDGFFIQLKDGALYGPVVKFDLQSGSLDIRAYTDGGYVDVFTGLSSETWYIFAMEFDLSGTDTFKLRYKEDGGSWSAWSSTYNTNGNGTEYDILKWGQDANWTTWFDEWSDSDPEPETPTSTPATTSTLTDIDYRYNVIGLQIIIFLISIGITVLLFKPSRKTL